MRSKLIFHIDAQDVAALHAHALLNWHVLSQSDAAEITEIYYDTPELLLKSKGADLSLQTNQKRWIQSLNIKTENNISNFTGGMLNWCNSAAYVASEQLHLSLFSAADMLKLGLAETSVLDGQFNQLQEIFRAQYQQQVWLLQFQNGNQASCAINQGRTNNASQSAEFCELEFELHKGNMLQLFDFVDTVMQRIPLTVRGLCRKEQGYALYRSQPTSATFASPPMLSRALPINDALDRIVVACLIQIQSNQAGVAIGGDRECLHQMRVGLRRLSAAARMCKKIQPFPDRVREEVKWLDIQLGMARDWDVFTATTLPKLLKLRVAKPAHGPLITPLLRAASDIARTAHASASATLTSPRYARLILNLLRWQFHLSDQPVQKPNNTNLARFSRQIIKSDLGPLHISTIKADLLQPEVLHKLRKKIKTLRYTVEFFNGLYTHKSMQHSMKPIAKLQDLLGAYNDSAVCERLVHQLLLDNPELQRLVHSVPKLLNKQSNFSKTAILKSLTKLGHTKRNLLRSGRQ